jgi:L-fuculose-phosphate aldolase
MKNEHLHPADQLVLMMNRVYKNGLTSTSGGNLSICDENGNIWITPSGIDKGTLRREDIMCVKPDGTRIGIHTPSMELPFHSSVYKIRSDIKCVFHAHPPALLTFSIARIIPDINLLPQVERLCGNITIAPYAIPGSVQLGKNISAQFKKGYDVVVMENHGVCIGAPDIFTAYRIFETLEYFCRIELNAMRLGKLTAPSAAETKLFGTRSAASISAFAKKAVAVKQHIPSSEECAVRRDIVTFVQRCYEQKLFSSTQGTFSAKLSDGSFIITPYGKDRAYLEERDLVYVSSKGKPESGKTPDDKVNLFADIYATHKDVAAITAALPPYTMGFAVSDAPFDPRTIPESYINLLDTKTISLADLYSSTKKVAALFTARTPALLIKNDSIVTVGKNMTNAYDRLEVAEFTANSILATKTLGKLVNMSAKEIDDIDKAFHV